MKTATARRTEERTAYGDESAERHATVVAARSKVMQYRLLTARRHAEKHAAEAAVAASSPRCNAVQVTVEQREARRRPITVGRSLEAVDHAFFAARGQAENRATLKSTGAIRAGTAAIRRAVKHAIVYDQVSGGVSAAGAGVAADKVVHDIDLSDRANAISSAGTEGLRTAVRRAVQHPAEGDEVRERTRRAVATLPVLPERIDATLLAARDHFEDRAAAFVLLKGTDWRRRRETTAPEAAPGAKRRAVDRALPCRKIGKRLGTISTRFEAVNGLDFPARIQTENRSLSVRAPFSRRSVEPVTQKEQSGNRRRAVGVFEVVNDSFRPA